MMHATSRESLATARQRLEELTSDADTGELRRLGAELTAILDVLLAERVLLRHLADPATAESARGGLATGVFGGKVGELASSALREVAVLRWSTWRDLADAVELLARQAVLIAAERENTLDETEDELFRFGRVLGSENELRSLLSDGQTPVDRRLGLLHAVLDGKAGRDSLDLLEQVVRVPRGRSLDVVVGHLAEFAAARRQRTVALVSAAAPLTEEQEERLARVLSQVYGRTISVQVELDPEVLGGLVIRVGDEVIDGSVANRLAMAARGLPA
jgi:F-type H+-transporting ATPase subunit delta